MRPNSKAQKKMAASKDKVRKSLHLLQPSATDKENLVGGGRTLRSGQKTKEMKDKSNAPEKTKTESSKSKVGTQNKATQTGQGKVLKFDIEDLTSTAGPSQSYWELLANRLRTELDEAYGEISDLKEQIEEIEELKERIKSLEEENQSCKEMLEQTTALVEVLQDMVGDDRNGINNSLEDSIL